MNLQHRFNFVQQLDRVAHFAIHLIDESDDRRIAQAAHFEQFDGLFFDTLGRIHHHHRRVDGGEHAVGVFGKIFVARRVEQVDYAIIKTELHHRAGHGDAALLFHL